MIGQMEPDWMLLRWRIEAYFSQVKNAFDIPLDEFQSRLRGIYEIEKWKRGSDPSESLNEAREKIYEDLERKINNID